MLTNKGEKCGEMMLITFEKLIRKPVNPLGKHGVVNSGANIEFID